MILGVCEHQVRVEVKGRRSAVRRRGTNGADEGSEVLEVGSEKGDEATEEVVESGRANGRKELVAEKEVVISRATEIAKEIFYHELVISGGLMEKL